MSGDSIALVHFQIRSLFEEKLLKDALVKLNGFRWNALSSIYRVHETQSATESIHDLRSRVSSESVVAVGLARTSHSPLACVAEVRDVERRLGEQEGRPLITVTLLLFDNQTVMLPNVTIPDPELHLKRAKLWPAAEVAPSWMHPVLGQDLRSLADRGGDEKEWGSFLAQGKSVLDF